MFFDPYLSSFYMYEFILSVSIHLHRTHPDSSERFTMMRLQTYFAVRFLLQGGTWSRSGGSSIPDDAGRYRAGPEVMMFARTSWLAQHFLHGPGTASFEAESPTTPPPSPSDINPRIFLLPTFPVKKILVPAAGAAVEFSPRDRLVMEDFYRKSILFSDMGPITRDAGIQEVASSVLCPCEGARVGGYELHLGDDVLVGIPSTPSHTFCSKLCVSPPLEFSSPEHRSSPSPPPAAVAMGTNFELDPAKSIPFTIASFVVHTQRNRVEGGVGARSVRRRHVVWARMTPYEEIVSPPTAKQVPRRRRFCSSGISLLVPVSLIRHSIYMIGSATTRGIFYMEPAGLLTMEPPAR
jgi:hypothetical protein